MSLLLIPSNSVPTNIWQLVDSVFDTTELYWNALCTNLL